jgi:hypothetical protein
VAGLHWLGLVGDAIAVEAKAATVAMMNFMMLVFGVVL